MKVHASRKARAISKQLLDMGSFSPGEKSRKEQLKQLSVAVHEHPWTYATVDAVSRSVLGAGWNYVKVERYKTEATAKQQKRLEDFFEYRKRSWDNVKDFQSFPDKLALTINAYRLFGHVAWEIVRDGMDNPIGFDVLSGITIPQVDKNGYFKSPAFLFYPWGSDNAVEYDKDEIAFFFNSGVTGSINGETIYSSLVNTSLPSDIFASISYRSMFENVNSPYNGVWNVDPAVSDEDFDMFVAMLSERYSGAENFGRNPLVIRGGAEFKQITSRSEEDAPYLDGRKYNREEFYAVTGVDGNKLGISGDANKSNIRETRREFHENVLRPMFMRLQEDIYYQINVRLLGINGWKLLFNQPDITTALEQATIDMREVQWGLSSPNEVRVRRGRQERADGDYYLLPINMYRSDEERPTSGSGKTGQDGTDDGNSDNTDPKTEPIQPSRPPRDEDPGTSDKALAIKELKNWKRVHLEVLDGKRAEKVFVPQHISQSVASRIQEMLDVADADFDLVKRIFSSAISVYSGDKND